MESIGLPTSETPTLQRDFPRRDSAATARCPVRKYQDERAIASKESTSLADRGKWQKETPKGRNPKRADAGHRFSAGGPRHQFGKENYMGGLGVLFNISSLESQNQLSQTNSSLQNTLTQLTTGSRINSGADDPAGLQISNLLNASIAALNQSVNNASDSVGYAQVADGALSQVGTLLNTAVTLATEASNGGLSSAQLGALGTEYNSILSEINDIGANTNYNGAAVFTSATTNAFLTDLTTSYTIGISTTVLVTGSTGLNLTTTDFTVSGNPQSALAQINSAIVSVGQLRGQIGAAINQLNDGSNIDTVEAQNTTTALNTINSANIPQVVSDLNKYTILEQTGIYSLTEANAIPQGLLKLLQ